MCIVRIVNTKSWESVQKKKTSSFVDRAAFSASRTGDPPPAAVCVLGRGGGGYVLGGWRGGGSARKPEVRGRQSKEVLSITDTHMYTHMYTHVHAHVHICTHRNACMHKHAKEGK
jgi:hypothetical protein